MVGGATVSLETNGMVAAGNLMARLPRKNLMAWLPQKSLMAWLRANLMAMPRMNLMAWSESRGMRLNLRACRRIRATWLNLTAWLLRIPTRSAVNSAVTEAVVGVPAPSAYPASSDFGGNCLPHSGQKLARTRMDTPQEGQRRAIWGSGIWEFRIGAFELRIFYVVFEICRFYTVLSLKPR